MKYNDKIGFVKVITSFIAFCTLSTASSYAQKVADPQKTLWPVQIRQDLIRLGNVEWRLRNAAGPHCPSQSMATGLILDYVGAYSKQDRPFVRQTLGLSNYPQIAAVVTGSPADIAGLKGGDDILAVNHVAISQNRAATHNNELLTDEILDRLASGPPDQPIDLLIQRGHTVLSRTVHPQQMCAARFIMESDDRIDAYSDKRNVGITSGLVRFTISDDELALVTGHELAHIIHRDSKSDGLKQRREMEKKADFLGAALAHCADYDVVRASEFWPRFTRHDWLSGLRLPTHLSSARRAAYIRDFAKGLTCEISP